MVEGRDASTRELDEGRIGDSGGVEFSTDANPATTTDEGATSVAIGGPFTTKDVVVFPAVRVHRLGLLVNRKPRQAVPFWRWQGERVGGMRRLYYRHPTDVRYIFGVHMTGPIVLPNSLDGLPGLRSKTLVEVFLAQEAEAALLFDEDVGGEDDLAGSLFLDKVMGVLDDARAAEG